MRRAIVFICMVIMFANVILAYSVVLAKTTIAVGSRLEVPADEQSSDESLANFIVIAASLAGYKTYDLYGADTTDLSNDGYANPDGSGYAFIGFHGLAPFLINTDPQFTEGSDFAYPLYRFAVEFYSALFGYYAAQRNVRESLDFASITVWGVKFSDCVLYTGYIAAGEESSMVVYGDGNLLLPTG